MSRPTRKGSERPTRATAKRGPKDGLSTTKNQASAGDEYRPVTGHQGSPWTSGACLCGCHFGDERCDEWACKQQGPGRAVSRARAPFFPHDSLQGPTFGKHDWERHPQPASIGLIDSIGDHVKLTWTFGDLCPKCEAPTDHGWCTRCTWVCDNADRPAPEPLLALTAIAS